MKRLIPRLLLALAALSSGPVWAQSSQTQLLLDARRAMPDSAAQAQDEKGTVGSHYGGSQLASQSELMGLGNVWSVNECCGWVGTWTRRPGSNQFNAQWRHTNGTVVSDTITLAEWNKSNNQVLLIRQGNNGRYRATYSPQSRTLIGGTTSWYPAGATWSAALR